MRETDGRLLHALRTLFRPLANVLLKNRIGIAPVIDQLKMAYVEAAWANHGRSGSHASINMIATLSGLSRNHVKVLLTRAKAEPSFDSVGFATEAGILGEWLSNENYVDKLGRPRALDLGPGDCTFHSLVAASVGSSNALSKMDALIQSECVVHRADGKVELAERKFPINQDLPSQIALFQSSVACTVDKNWGRGVDDGFLIRAAHSGRVDPHKIALIRRLAKERSVKFLEDIDDVLHSYQCEAAEPMVDPEGNELSRVGVSVCYFELD